MPNDKPAPVEHNLMVILDRYLNREDTDYGDLRRARNAVELLVNRAQIVDAIFNQYRVSYDVLSGDPREQIQALYTTWLKDNSIPFQPTMYGRDSRHICIEGHAHAMMVVDWMLMQNMWFIHGVRFTTDTGTQHPLVVNADDLDTVLDYCKRHNIEVK